MLPVKTIEILLWFHCPEKLLSLKNIITMFPAPWSSILREEKSRSPGFPGGPKSTSCPEFYSKLPRKPSAMDSPVAPFLHFWHVLIISPLPVLPLHINLFPLSNKKNFTWTGSLALCSSVLFHHNMWCLKNTTRLHQLWRYFKLLMRFLYPLRNKAKKN